MAAAGVSGGKESDRGEHRTGERPLQVNAQEKLGDTQEQLSAYQSSLAGWESSYRCGWPVVALQE